MLSALDQLVQHLTFALHMLVQAPPPGNPLSILEPTLDSFFSRLPGFLAWGVCMRSRLRYQQIFWPNTSPSQRTTGFEIRCPVHNPQNAGSLPVGSATSNIRECRECNEKARPISADRCPNETCHPKRVTLSPQNRVALCSYVYSV